MENLRMIIPLKTESEKKLYSMWSSWANDNGYALVPTAEDQNVIYAQKVGEKDYIVEQEDGSVLKLPYNPNGKAIPAGFVEIVEFMDGKTYLKGKEPKKTAELVRSKRNEYLKMYVDPMAGNSLRWADLTEEERQSYSDYRKYLLDIPQKKGFPNVDVLTFEEWKKDNE